MTSQRFSSNKNSKRYDLKQSFKSVIIPTIISFLALLQRFVLYSYDELRTIIENLGYNGKVQNELTVGLLPEYHSVLAMFELVLIGVFFAKVAFRPFLRKRNANFFFSSPVTRADMFANRTIASLVMMTASIFVPILIDAIVNCYYLDNDGFIIGMALSMLFQSIVVSFVAFGIFAVAMCCASNVLEGLIFGVGLYGFPTGITLVADWFCESFLDGYARANALSDIMGATSMDVDFSALTMLNATCHFNPISLATRFGAERIDDSIFTLCYQRITEGRPNIIHPTINYYIPLIIWCAVFVVITFVARYAFINRKSENLGMVGRNKGIIAFIATEVALGISTVWIGLFGSGDFDLPIFRALIIIGLFILVWAIYFALVRVIRKDKRVYTYAGVLLAVMICSMGVLSSGFFGYSTYVPNVDDIEYATINGTQITGDMCPDAPSMNIYNNYTGNWAMTLLDERDDLVQFTKVHKALVSGKKDKDNFITIKYQLKNGKIIFRRYDKVSAKGLALVPSLVDTDEYREYLYYYLTGDGEDTFAPKAEKYDMRATHYFNLYYGEVKKGKGVEFDELCVGENDFEKIKADKADGIRQALVADFKNMTYEDFYFSKVAPLGYISLTCSGDVQYVDEGFYDYIDTNEIAKFCVYPYMTNTIDYLKSIDMFDKMINANPIADTYDKVYYQQFGDNAGSIYFMYDYISYIDDDMQYYEMNPEELIGVKNSTTDKAVMQELLDNGITQKFANPDDYMVVFVRNRDPESNYMLKRIVTADTMNKILK